ncbi:MAG: GNAT family N-acetyltransferase [Bacilli bacterium]|nr:GNAT family N-acetyltransferase [Bacilli bacterium]
MKETNLTNQGYEIVFESENIYYVKLDERLVNDYLIMVNDPNVANKISHKTRTYTYEQELNWVKSKLEENALCFSMLEKTTGEYIGNIEIMVIKDNIGELGISITASKQDKHYGTESIKALLKYAYGKLNLYGIELDVYATNSKAIHCYEKVGFIKDGIGKTEEDVHMRISR